MVASFALIRSSAYYTRESSAVRYYEVGAEASGIWLRGHERLGVTAGTAVRAPDFDRACQGLDRMGRLLVRHAGAGKRTLGVDLTLSSPKSVSVAWALGDAAMRETIEAAEREAVEAIIRLVEAEIPLARRGRAGSRRERAAFAVAAFTHSEARPERHADGTVMPSPQRHHHLCWPNIGERADGTWGALDTVALRSWRNAIGSQYRLAVATALQQRGLAIEVPDNDWRWSVRGVPEALCRFFSARRASIEEELAEAGVTSGAAPALAAAVTLAGRRDKQAVAGPDLIWQWKDAAAALGHPAEAVLADVRAAGRAAAAELTTERCEALATERVASVPAALTGHSATFERRHLIEAVANALVGSRSDPARTIEMADALVADGRVATLGEARCELVYSTPAMIATERRLVEVARRLAGERVAAPDPALVTRLVAEQNLNAEQAAVARAATSGARLTLVQGAAGTGKSTTLSAITRAWQSEGYTVVGAAIAWRAAHGLRDDLGVASRAIDSWLARDGGERPIFGPKTCLLVEEGGLQASPQALQLLRQVERTGGVAVIVGDENQLRPIGPGHAMRLIREVVGASEIATVVRQREAWAREAPQAFARGGAAAALATFDERGLVHFHDGPRATVEAVAAEWQRQRDAAPERSVLVTAKTNAEVRAVSTAIRRHLRERDMLRGPDVIAAAADASGNGYQLRLAEGDRVRFLVRQDALGVINGTEAEIAAIREAADGSVRIAARVGERTVEFAPADVADDQGRAKLAHAYAATIFQAQGITVDATLVLLSARFDRHDAYVAASRARGDTVLFVDSRTLDREMAADTLELVQAGDRDARLGFLAERLARASAKTTTLDLLAAELKTAATEWDRSRARERRRELGHEL
ncbi:MobF family relaxase [Aureimonas leprariae]|uniref:MobF family relaxase n=1 Tax=Plantimonas leprariae TaxID=2615207 RepID=UPI00138715E1|nr:MobF family relaxase [Aureimonas leprariae]